MTGTKVAKARSAVPKAQKQKKTQKKQKKQKKHKGDRKRYQQYFLKKGLKRPPAGKARRPLKIRIMFRNYLVIIISAVSGL